MSNCPLHLQPFRLVPAGTSKTTQRPYAAFWACPTMGCKQKPDQTEVPLSVDEPLDRKIMESQPPKAPEKAEVDWDGKERRMVRMNVLNRTTDLIIAGQIDIKDLDKTVDRLESIIYKESAQNERN